jgi:import inner membrane translocase subunit TIM16
VNGIRKASKAITEQEARQILGVSEKTSWEEILKVCACVTIKSDFF